MKVFGNFELHLDPCICVHIGLHKHQSCDLKSRCFKFQKTYCLYVTFYTLFEAMLVNSV